MSVPVLEYQHSAYSSLSLYLGDVDRSIQAKGGRDAIDAKLGHIFKEHKVDQKFGLGLLHRHFDLSPNERLVEVNDVAVPWTVDEIARLGCAIYPTAWFFKEGALVPYEYAFGGPDPRNAELFPNPADHPEFLKVLSSHLTEHGLQDLLSLRVHPGPDFKGSVEFTVGRASISLPPSVVSINHTVVATFFFDPVCKAQSYAKKCDHGKCD